MDIPVYNTAGQLVSHVTVDEAVLGDRPNMPLLRQALVMYEANRRVGTAKTKRRDDVRGSGAKPWRQKHTGRARHGSRYSPLWVGGATAHGPVPRDHRQKMPRAARRKALLSAFLAKGLDGRVLAVEGLVLPDAPKTKHVAAILKNLGVDRSFLLVITDHDADVWRCTRNIRGASLRTHKELNAYEVTRPQRVIFTLEALQSFLEGVASPVEAEGEAEVSPDG